MNLDSGTIEDRFQSYVRPTRSPKLSQFCINLTGIRQDIVDRQQSFPTVYLKLADWIQRIELEYSLRFASPSQRNADFNGINATFCSWSDTDLKSYFKSECRRLNISALSCFKTWIDVRQSFNVSEPEHHVINQISQNRLFWIKKTVVFFICSARMHLDGANFLKHYNMLGFLQLDKHIQLCTMLKIWPNWWYIWPNVVHNSKRPPIFATMRLPWIFHIDIFKRTTVKELN